MDDAAEAIIGVAEGMRRNSERWFADFHADGPDLRVFYALGLAGEAGEVANVVKKMIRGKGEPGLDESLAAELADVFTYLLLLADEVGVDLVFEYRQKILVNEARWGERGEVSGRE